MLTGSMLLAMSRREEEDAMAAGAAAVAGVVGVVALVFATKKLRAKQSGLAAVLFFVGIAALLSCLGLSAVLVLAQFAWH